MPVQETTAKSLLRKQKKIESWFVTRYAMNLYRGCVHNCVYCDGRDDKYRVEGVFGRDIEVKANAIELLTRELDPKRKRKPMKPGFIFLGGGVGDSYNPYEKKYELTKQALEVIEKYDFPVHILTKSALVLRDLEALKRIHSRRKVIVSFSISTTDDVLAHKLEPGASPPSERLQALKKLHEEGISGGMYLLPVLPFLTDTQENLEKSVSDIKDAGADFIVFGGLTLKQGTQGDYYYKFLQKNFPNLVKNYKDIYKNAGRYGSASGEHTDSIHYSFRDLIKKYEIPARIPKRLFIDQIDKKDFIIVILEHIDYYMMLYEMKSNYGYVAYQISNMEQPMDEILEKLDSFKGMDKKIKEDIIELYETGGCARYKFLRK